jgi:hypothetical protein
LKVGGRHGVVAHEAIVNRRHDVAAACELLRPGHHVSLRLTAAGKPTAVDHDDKGILVLSGHLWEVEVQKHVVERVAAIHFALGVDDIADNRDVVGAGELGLSAGRGDQREGAVIANGRIQQRSMRLKVSVNGEIAKCGRACRNLRS